MECEGSGRSRTKEAVSKSVLASPAEAEDPTSEQDSWYSDPELSSHSVLSSEFELKPAESDSRPVPSVVSDLRPGDGKGNVRLL